MVINPAQYVRTLSIQLQKIYDDTLANRYSWWLLEYVTQLSYAELIVRSAVTLSEEQISWLATAVYDLVEKHKPLQYILGTVPFLDLTITVEPPLLIPRHSTEEWVHVLIEQLALYKNEPLNILDLCTGTGCIALALAHALPNSHVIAVDLESHAVELARKNAARNSISNVSVLQGDLFSPLSPDMQFDLIVTNPPYIDIACKNTLDRSVSAWEDPRALYAPDSGYALIKKIISEAASWMKPQSCLDIHDVDRLWIEIGHDQAAAVCAYAREHDIPQPHVWYDGAGHSRVVKGRYEALAVSPRK